MKYVYTAVFTPEPSKETEGKTLYCVEFPDLGCHTCGQDLSNALDMAKDVLCLHLYELEQEGKPIPAATLPQNIKVRKGEFLTAVDVDTEFYVKFYEKKAVKKTLTIPSWLNQRAETANINFSKVLQKALKEELQLAVVE